MIRNRPRRAHGRCELRHVGAGALDGEAGEHPVEPAGQPPVAVTEQLHRCGDEDHPHEGRIDEHRDRQPEADQLQSPDVGHDEAAEHTDHDRSRSGDHPGRRRQALARRPCCCRPCGRTPHGWTRAGRPRSPWRDRRRSRRASSEPTARWEHRRRHRTRCRTIPTGRSSPSRRRRRRSTAGSW